MTALDKSGLAAIRGRADATRDMSGGYAWVGRLADSAADVPRLLAAIDTLEQERASEVTDLRAQLDSAHDEYVMQRDQIAALAAQLDAVRTAAATDEFWDMAGPNLDALLAASPADVLRARDAETAARALAEFADALPEIVESPDYEGVTYEVERAARARAAQYRTERNEPRIDLYRADGTPKTNDEIRAEAAQYRTEGGTK